MDDNKINPEVENENSVEESVETEAPAEKTFDELMQEAEQAETTVSVDESAEAVISEVQENLEKPKKKKKKGKVCAIIIIVALLISATAMLVYFMLGSENKLGVDVDETVLSVADVDSNVGEFVNVYGMYSYYASYYGFTEDEIKEYAIEELITVNSYYAKAIAAGYELTEDMIAEIDETIAQVTVGAEAYSMTADEYLADYVCDGYDLEMYRAYLEKQYVAQMYYSDMLDGIDAEYTGEAADEKVQALYEEDRTTYDLSDASYWYVDTTEDDAQTTIDAVIANVNKGMSFDEAIAAVDADATSSSLTGYSLSTLSSNFSSSAAEWIFELSDGEYVNGAGSITTIEDSSVTYIIYVNNAPSKNEAVPVTVDCIAVYVDTDTSVKSEAELELAAKSTATSILNEFESGTIDAYSFATLRATYNDDEDYDLVYGETLSEIVADGSNDEAVEAWVFDEDRQVGDYALVEGDGCYYILYYMSVNDYAVWYQTALDTLLNDAYSAAADAVLSEYDEQTVLYDDIIAQVVTYMTAA